MQPPRAPGSEFDTARHVWYNIFSTVFQKTLDSIVNYNVIMAIEMNDEQVIYMLKIGEFAKICGASVQTLRYYDKIGVLCADRVDAESGYRYYAPEKIKTFRLIEQLKQLDFSLDEIKEFLTCTPAQQCRIYAEKKLALIRIIRQKKVLVNQIDENCGNVQPDAIPLIKEILTMPFEDDPQVIGKWVYCGDSEKRESSSQ